MDESFEPNCDVWSSVDFGGGVVQIRCTRRGDHLEHICHVVLHPNGPTAVEVNGGRVPEDGDPVTFEDVEMILDAIMKRQEKFDEPAGMSVALVMLNIGNRFAVVTCQEQEWSGLVKDIPPGEGVPKCPNGHTLTKGPGMRLAWVAGPTDEEILERAANN